MSVVASMLRYDFKRFVRDRFIFVMTLVSLLLYGIGGQYIPESIAPQWRIAAVGDTADRMQAAIEANLKARENQDSIPFEVVRFESEEEMRKAFLDEEQDFFVGIALDAGAKETIASGGKAKARIYVDENAPPAAQESARAVGAVLANSQAAVAGWDKPRPKMLGPKVEDVSFGHRTRTLLAFMVLMMEMIALASLVSKEISGGVVHAVLTTTVSLPRYFASKVLFGVLLAFSQAILLAGILGVLSVNPLVIGALLLCAAVTFTGFGIIAGTRGKHLMEVMMWSILFIAPCLIPSIASMLPGTAPLAVQVLPTYPVVQGLLSAGHEAPLVAPGIYIVWAGAWSALALVTSYFTLRRRVK